MTKKKLTATQLECALDNLENRADGNLHATGNLLRAHISTLEAENAELRQHRKTLDWGAREALGELSLAFYPPNSALDGVLREVSELPAVQHGHWYRHSDYVIEGVTHWAYKPKPAAMDDRNDSR